MNELAEAKIKEVLENFDFKKVIKTMKFLGYGYGVNSELPTEKYLKQEAEKTFKHLLENKGISSSIGGRFLYKRNAETNDFYMCFISEEYYTVTKNKFFVNLFWYLADNLCLKRKIMKTIKNFFRFLKSIFKTK